MVMALPMFSLSQENIADEFIARRLKVLSMLDSSSAIVLKSININPLSNDYVQEHNFYYLTGINTPSVIVLMVQRGIKVGKQLKSTLIFCNDIDEAAKVNLTKNDTILNSFEFKAIFATLLPSLKKLYYSAPDLNLVNDWLNDKAYFMEREMKNGLKAKNSKLQLIPADNIVGKLRAVKSPLEISLIRKTSDITADGLVSAMKIAKSGVWEYELQAAIEYEFTHQGALLRGFPSIVGSGLNNLILHYFDNNRQMQDGDLVVIDIGAKYQGYSSDITRTIPVSGKFTDAQKEIYNMVLQVQKEAIAILKPGLSTFELEEFARKAFKKLGYEKFYPHALSHPVGLDVHDVMSESVLKPGMVITIEPGLYFNPKDKTTPEKYRGFGVRIEDTILITENGCEILSKNAPKEIDEVEKMMKKKR